MHLDFTFIANAIRYAWGPSMPLVGSLTLFRAQNWRGENENFYRMIASPCPVFSQAWISR